MAKNAPSTCLKVSVFSFDSNLQTVQRHIPSLLTILLDTSSSISEKASDQYLHSIQGSQADRRISWGVRGGTCPPWAYGTSINQ